VTIQRLTLSLLASGMPNKVIARRLGMSLSTVKAHAHHIIRKLRVGNPTEAALLTRPGLRPRLPRGAGSGTAACCAPSRRMRPPVGGEGPPAVGLAELRLVDHLRADPRINSPAVGLLRVSSVLL
jgi:hypothetical protein